MSRRWSIVLLAVAWGIQPSGTLENNFFQLQVDAQQDYLQAGETVYLRPDSDYADRQHKVFQPVPGPS